MVPMKSVHRVRLFISRYNMGNASKACRTAKNMDGAKSFGKTVPPIGAGNRTIFFKVVDKARRSNRRYLAVLDLN